MGTRVTKHSVQSSSDSQMDVIEEDDYCGELFSEETQSELTFLDRESTGTSGYSSYSCVTPVNSTGKRSQTDIQIYKRGLKQEDRRKILKNFRYLKGELDADIISDYFIRDSFFDTNDLEEIKAEIPRHRQVDVLLRKVLRLEADAYPKFLQYLEEAGYAYVCKILEEPKFIQALNYENITDGDASARLTRYEDQILDQLEPDSVADIFVEYEEFSIDEFEEIMVYKTRRSKSKRLLDLLMMPEHTQSGYLILLQALRETDGLYLSKLLEDGPGADKCTNSPARYEVNVDSRRMGSKKALEALKGSEQCQLNIKIKSDEDIKQLEVAITKEMNKCDVIVSMNNNIILEKECLITSVEQGSIIITIKGCRPNSMRRIFHRDVSGPVLEILRHIFLHSNIVSLLPRKGLLLELTLNCLPSESKERERSSDIMKFHMDFLVEELDALGFLKPLKDKRVFSSDEVQKILEVTPTSRKSRTKAMIDKILEKDVADEFLDLLKDKKRYVWEQVFKSNVTDQSHIQTIDLATSYKEIADNLSANLLVKQGSLRTVVQIQSDSSWSREMLAQHILQQVLRQNFDTKMHFIHLLRLYDQIPPEVNLPGARGMLKSNNSDQAHRKETERKMLEPAEVFVWEFTVSLKEYTGMRLTKTAQVLSPKAITQSVTRQLEKTTQKKDGRDSSLINTKI